MRIRIPLTAAVLTVGLAFPSLAGAQLPIHGIARFGLEHGGDRVIEFVYEDGSTPDVTAGGGLLLSIGGGTQLAGFGRQALDAQVNVGIKWRTIPDATNQTANWLRFPVEGLVFYRLPSGFRVGGGATVHIGNALKSSGEVFNDKVEFRNTPGFIVQAEYIRRNLSFDVRYTMLDYEAEGGGTIDASSIGAGISFLFGQRAAASAGSSGNGAAASTRAPSR